ALHFKFSNLDVTPEWVKFDEHDRRECVTGGQNWVEQVNRLIASCIFHGIPVNAAIRASWERLTKQMIHCKPTKERTWFELEAGAPTDADRMLHPPKVLELSAVHEASKGLCDGVYLLQGRQDHVFCPDTGCTPRGLTHPQTPGLFNIKQLPADKVFHVRGIAGDVAINSTGFLTHKVPSALVHDDLATQEALASLQASLVGEDSLHFYFTIEYFLDASLRPGLSLLSLGQQVKHHGWAAQLDSDPAKCFALSPVDARTGLRFKVPMAIGFGTEEQSDVLLRYVGMQIVADGVDGVEQAQRAWDVARVLYQQASEQVAGAQRTMLAAVAEQANSLGGYAFYVGPVPEPAPVVQRPVAGYVNPFFPLGSADVVVESPSTSVPWSLVGLCVPPFVALGRLPRLVLAPCPSAGSTVPSSDPCPRPFSKRLFNQLAKAAKRMASRRQSFPAGHHRALVAEVITGAMVGEADARPFRRPVSAPLVTGFPTSDELGALHRRLRELSDPIILDFCAGSRPFARVLLPELSNLRVVSIDCEHLPPLDLTAAEHARHLEIVADLNTLTMQDIAQRVWERFRLPLANVVFQGAFPTCTHISTASVVGGAHPHRNPDYSPSTPAAVASDALLLKSLALVAEIHRTYGAPGVVEQPASEVLFQVPSFRSWLEANPQVTVNYYDQCAVSLPGEVTPKKPTV
ncbi:MAG: hypothetical protein ACOYMN_23295, partial [Roseimicrobium sp.]